jgi:anaerobic selenocysteine-containing dehydrogenase
MKNSEDLHSKVTACPLDCYDACRMSLDENGTLRGDPHHRVTRGALCPSLNRYDTYARIERPRLYGEEISMEKGIEALTEVLKAQKSDRILYYRGSGNIGLMQRVCEHFFGSIHAVGTSGTLCDGAGEAGVLAGRGSNEVLSPQMIAQSDVVVIWGRNVAVTQSHLMPFLEGKKVIVIDPRKSALSDKADLHLQIKPHCDLYLALILSRFVIIEGIHDVEFLEEYASGYNDFYELTQSLRIKSTLEAIDLTLGEIGAMLELIRGAKTAILVGNGVQKYRDGSDVLRAIDGFGALLGLFGKAGCGVSYLGDSLSSLSLPFQTCQRRVSKATVDFSKYNCVFVQGGNPLGQMPDTARVEKGFDAAGFRVYFGLYENETSQRADLVIPAKTFLEKNDFRSSYGDYTLQEMAALREGEIGISEYALAGALCAAFGIEIAKEEEYLDFFRSQIEEKEGIGYRKGAPEIPYEKGFAHGEFEFLEEIDSGMDKEEGFFLLTPKHSKGINSQFHRPEGVYFHPEAGFMAGERVRLTSPIGSIEMEVKHDARLRCDCLLIYAGTVGVNYLTPPYLSYEGESAVYQEFKIKVTQQ